MKIDVPHGEVADRISILTLKSQRITDPAALGDVTAWLTRLHRTWSNSGLPALDALEIYAELAQVNADLWDVEDALRRCEAEQRFDGRFVELARSVYRLNDRRAALKRAINEQTASELSERKSYGESR